MSTLALLVGLAFATTTINHPEEPTLRLSTKDVRPLAYEIQARVVPSEATFTATTSIVLQVDARTDRVWLNQRGVEVLSAKLIEEDGREFEAKVVPGKGEFVAIEVVLQAGSFPRLVLETRAPISRKETHGVIASDSGDAVFTNFEPANARRAFALFDEPSFKVPFQLTLTVPKHLVALSNTPVEKESVSGAFKTITFARTTPLPSYLFAFAVGPFELLDAGKAGKNQVPVRIVVPKGSAARAKAAVEQTKEVIERLEAWFGSPFPYPKLDMIAVTNTGFSGAMENPGLVTWSQTSLLAGATGDTISRRRWFLSTTTHELAHQWFGNLVTAAWWDDIWLNESFADYVMSDVMAAWKPEWKEEIDRVEAREGALGSDAQASSRRIREPIVTGDDIENAFDSITYSKGQAVLFMFEHWLGREPFRKGVRLYLERHAQKNATVGDFLGAVSEATGKDVSGPFTTFLDQAGFPLVTGALDCAGGKPKLTLSQERYAPLGTKLPAQTWKVPVCVRWEGDGRQCVLLAGASQTVALEAKACPKQLVLNDGAVGYYRVRPVPVDLLREGTALSAVERLALSSDLASLVQRGDLSVAEELGLVGAFAASNERALVERAAEPIFSLEQLLPESSLPKLRAFARSNFSPVLQKLGPLTKDEPDETRIMRANLLRVLSDVADDPAASAEATKLFTTWLKDRKVVPADLLGAAGPAAARRADVKLYDTVVKAMEKEQDVRDRRVLIHFLGEVRDPALMKRSLELVLKGNVRERVGVLYALGGRAEGRPLVFAWLKQHYDELVAKLPDEWHASLVYTLTGWCDRAHRDEVAAFFEPRTTKAPGGPREFAGAMEGFDQCVAWREKQVPEAVKFLEK
ncbi:MAG: M1 family metallopeptidase [Myxococcaceae bacterium]